MPDLAHPTFAHLLAEIRSRPGDVGVCDMACDWLMEHGATTADVLKLYALPPGPPEHCTACDNTKLYSYMGETPRPCPYCCMPAIDDTLRPLLLAWCARLFPERMDAVRTTNGWKMIRHGDTSPGWCLTNNDGRTCDPPNLPEAAARRELKRRVLAAFDDQRVPCPQCLNIEGNGMLFCSTCKARGYIKPSELIPEPLSNKIVYGPRGEYSVNPLDS
jgi:hypothetical protein